MSPDGKKLEIPPLEEQCALKLPLNGFMHVTIPFTQAVNPTVALKKKLDAESGEKTSGE